MNDNSRKSASRLLGDRLKSEVLKTQTSSKNKIGEDTRDTVETKSVELGN